MRDFNNLTNNFIENIKTGKVIHPYANRKLEIRKGQVHKNVSLFYKIDKENNKIYLITFFNNRMNPKGLRKLLK